MTIYKKQQRIERAKVRKAAWDKLSVSEKKAQEASNKALYDREHQA